MNKYIQKLCKWGIFSVFLCVSCVPKKRLTFQTCQAITQESECSELGLLLKERIDGSNSGFSLGNKRNPFGEYYNFHNLFDKKVDAAMLFYDALKEYAPYEGGREEMKTSKKFFLIPFLIVAKASFSDTSIQALTSKTWNIGIPEDPIEDKLIRYLFKLYDIPANFIRTPEMNILSLLEDGNIDFFSCFSMACTEILYQSPQIVGPIQILSLPSLQTLKQHPRYFVPVDVSSSEGLFSPAYTYAQREYLVMRKDLPYEKQQLFIDAFDSSNILEDIQSRSSILVEPRVRLSHS